MSRLQNFERAILDVRKLADYCLNPAHPRGRHKARVFRQALGIERMYSPWLREAILAGLATAEAEQQISDEFGSRWRVDIPIARQGKQAVIASIWIIRAGETAPRFVTCWIV
ncbi:MAG TPA: hypothetical protein VGM17_08800 [Rhizomicrobium sp.]|jgi:hypothetical protein